MSKFQYRIPDKESPGFLRRSREALRLRDSLTSNPTAETVDNMVSFLAEYIVEPADRDGAINALLEASENEIKELLTAVTGGNDLVPPKKGGDLEGSFS